MRKNLLFIFLFTGICYLAAVSYSGQEHPWQELTKIELKKISDQRSKVILTLTGEVKYRDFIVNQELLVLDLENTLHNWPQKNIEAEGNPLITRVRSAQYEDQPIKISRVVIELKELVPHKVSRQDNQIVIDVGVPEEEFMEEVEVSPRPEEVSPKEEVKIVKKPPVKPKPKPKPKPPAKPRPKIERHKEDRAHRELVKKIRREEKKAVSPIVSEERKEIEKEKEEISISKMPVSLDFNEADIRDVLRILGIKGGINIVYGEDVRGNVTIHLEEVPFDQALNVLLKVHGLTCKKMTKNVIRVMTPEVAAKERERELTVTKIFHFNYALAADVQKTLEMMWRERGREGVREREYEIGLDEKNNNLVIRATPAMLENLGEIFKKLDVPAKQVMIDAKIVEVNSDRMREVGINWDFSRKFEETGFETGREEGATHAEKGRVRFPFTQTGVGQARERMTAGGQRAEAGGGSFGSLTVSAIMSEIEVKAVLNAIVTRAQGKILSNPRVTTVNNKEASILMGDKVPLPMPTYALAGAGGGAGMAGMGGAGGMGGPQFVDTGITLTVTPSISKDNRITLKVHPEVSSYTQSTLGPIIHTRETTTNVLVRDGDTIVLGGLISENKSLVTARVPFLGDIPMLGALFRYQHTSTSRQELLVFLTPHILE